jgi:enoyl-CoA hydratase/3-hydroxyacyl-CoA dehydrogenase
LKTAFEAAHADPRVKSIVVTGSKGKFSGGFDITQLKLRTEGKPAPNVADFNAVLNALVEAGPKPTVAAIENLALGGGLELAMACNARVCTPKAQLGLPELQLGVIPGFGGTQRLPRLVGLPKALEMIMKSKPVKAEEALKLGLVDQVVPRAVAARRGDGARGGHRRQARAARHGVLPLGQDSG